MSSYKWLLDAGHGGVTADGTYLSAPEKTHVFKDGLTINEGVINRAIVDNVIRGLLHSKVDYEMVHDEFIDKSPAERADLANQFYAEDRRCIYLSIHTDRMPKRWRGRKQVYGVYTATAQAMDKVGRTKSKEMADNFLFAYDVSSDKFNVRKDYVSVDTIEDYAVLRQLDCPAMLIQNLFFDNRKDAEYLLSEDGLIDISNAILCGIWHSETINGYDGWMGP